jgi:hypothetical protein
VEGFYYLDGVRYNKTVTVDGSEVRAVLPISAANNGLIRVVAVIDGKKHIGAYSSSIDYTPVIVYPPDDATVLSAKVKWVDEGISVSVKVLYPEFGWDLLIINGDSGDIIRKYKVPAGQSEFLALYSFAIAVYFFPKSHQHLKSKHKNPLSYGFLRSWPKRPHRCFDK